MENKFEYRPYQLEDIKFLSSLDAGACFNEQRTGKTPTMLGVIKQRNLQKHKVLIICPNSVINVWENHWKQHISSDTAISLTGATRLAKQKQLQNWKVGCLIVGYDSLKRTKTCEGLIDEIKTKAPRCVILDEAHRINGRTTATAKAVNSFRKTPIKYVLTGTPTKGRAHHIYAILHWLYPDYFTSYWRFVKTHFKTWTINANQPITQIGTFLPGQGKKLWKLLDTFSTQRKRTDIMQWLPNIQTETVTLELSPQQAKHVVELRNYFQTEDLSVPNVLSALIRERQICLNPKIIGLSHSDLSPKDEWLLQYLKDYPDQAIIIISKFKTYLDHLKNLLPHSLYVHGGMTQQTLVNLTTQFQNTSNALLLAQVDIVKEGLTLDNADTIIFTDQYPPVGDIEQAKDRLIPTTPDRVKTKMVYSLVMQDSYEEVIEKLLKGRKSETDLINDYKRRLTQ